MLSCGFSFRRAMGASTPFFLLVLMGCPVWAASEAKDCPAESTSTTALRYGDVYSGPDCLISPVADTDAFRFGAKANDLIQLIGYSTGGGNVCLTLTAPSGAPLFTGCTVLPFGYFVTALTRLPVTGSYSVVVSASNPTNYALSLERVMPASPGAVALTAGQAVSDELNPATDQDEYVFNGRVGDVLRISGTAAGPNNLCMMVTEPDGTKINSQCTTVPFAYTVQYDLTVAQAGTHTILLTSDGTTGYSLSLTCLSATCQTSPRCTLKATGSYAGTTLNLNFTVGTLAPATWNIWLAYGATVALLESNPLPKTDPPQTISKSYPNSPQAGYTGVLTTLTYPSAGILCSVWTPIKPSGAAAVDEPGRP